MKTLEQNEENLSTVEQKQEVLATCFQYLDQIKANRFIIERLYLEQNLQGATSELNNLMNGLVWLEYAVLLLNVRMDADEKNRLFEGIKEAIDIHDWFSIIDFLTTPLEQYIQILNRDFTKKAEELIQGYPQ